MQFSFLKILIVLNIFAIVTLMQMFVQPNNFGKALDNYQMLIFLALITLNSTCFIINHSFICSKKDKIFFSVKVHLVKELCIIEKLLKLHHLQHSKLQINMYRKSSKNFKPHVGSSINSSETDFKDKTCSIQCVRPCVQKA